MRSTLIISAYARYAIIEKSISRKKKVNLKMEMKSSEVGKEVHFDFLFSSLTLKNNTCVIRHASANNMTSSCVLINTLSCLFITIVINYKAIGYSSYVINFIFQTVSMEVICK